MKNLKKIASFTILFTVILALSAGNAVHAQSVTATINVGSGPTHTALMIRLYALRE